MLMVDTNMDTARRWANELGPPPPLPPSLQDVGQRAKLVIEINWPLIHGDALERLSTKEKAQRLNDVAGLSGNHMPDVDDDSDRDNITLRLWSGCLDAAKTIALETMNGPNTPSMRALAFGRKIDPTAQEDPIYCAGIEAAPSFKRLLEEDYSFEGVPENSPVGRYP